MSDTDGTFDSGLDIIFLFLMQESVADTLFQVGQGGRIFGQGHEESKFVAAHPGYQVVAAEAAAQNLRHPDQHLVSKEMALLVVDRLKIIHIQHPESIIKMLQVLMCQHIVDAFLKSVPVQKAGEGFPPGSG